MDRIIVEKSKFISTKDVNLSEGVIIVNYIGRPIGSAFPSQTSENSIRMITVFEDNIFDSLGELIDAFFDYEFIYVTE